jgi:hypothetical protein
MFLRILSSLIGIALAPMLACAQPAIGQAATSGNVQWGVIGRVFGQPGEAEGRYFRINLPRTDLHVRIGKDELSPDFEFKSYVGFIPMGAQRVMGMGEVVLRDDEVPAVLAEAHRQNIQVSAVHNHLIGETPRIIYVHVTGEGAPEALAKRLRAVYAASHTPLSAPKEEPARGDWSAIDAMLGPHAEAEGPIAEYVFKRNEHLSLHGMAIESTGMLESASEVVFEQLPGGRVANTGELFVLPKEVDPVLRALDEHGLHVTAVHNHMVDEIPRMYWIHWYTTGSAPTIARGVVAALAHMNSARRSQKE